MANCIRVSCSVQMSFPNKYRKYLKLHKSHAKLEVEYCSDKSIKNAKKCKKKKKTRKILDNEFAFDSQVSAQYFNDEASPPFLMPLAQRRLSLANQGRVVRSRSRPPRPRLKSGRRRSRAARRKAPSSGIPAERAWRRRRRPAMRPCSL